VPADVVDQVEIKPTSRDRLLASLEKTAPSDKPVLDFLQDK
jgi:hypothetical protein